MKKLLLERLIRAAGAATVIAIVAGLAFRGGRPRRTPGRATG